VCANRYARKVVDQSVRNHGLELTRAQRAAKISRKAAYLQRLLYKRIATEFEKWYTGVDFIDPHSPKVYRMKIVCIHSLFDLPAVGEATGQVR
jgi:uncharacterized protein (DUF2147 family)